jgi:hypothetical protein
VYGTGETIKYSYSRNILEISSKVDDSSDTSDLNYSYPCQDETVFDNTLPTDTASFLSIPGSSTIDTWDQEKVREKKDSVVKTLYPDQLSSPWIGSNKKSSEGDCSDECSSSYDDFADNHSSLMRSIRQRCDTDASIEIYGSDQKVKFDSSSNTIEVRKIHRFTPRDDSPNNSGKADLLTINRTKPGMPNQEQWMDGTDKSLSSRNQQSKKLPRRPPKLPRQSSFGKRKEIEKDIENSGYLK